MKKVIFCALVLLLAVPLKLRAEDIGGQADLGSTSARPPVAHADQVAMMYWLLAKQAPDFERMGKATKEYQQAGQFDKDQALAGQVAYLKNIYDSTTFSQPTVVDMVVHLSPYSEKNKGFVITDFQDQTYFKYDNFGGDNYAIVPRGLMDHQFLGPIGDPAFVKKILANQHAFGVFHLMVYLKPDYADPPDTLTEIDGKRYHILSGTVSHVSLFNMQETEQLWGDNSSEFNKAQEDQLLNLKQ